MDIFRFCSYPTIGTKYFHTRDKNFHTVPETNIFHTRNKMFPHQFGKFSFSFLSYKRNKKFPHQRRKIATTEQNRKENILNGGLENVPKQLEKYSFPEKNIKSKIFFVITIIFTTPVNKFELMKHFQKTLYTFPQIQRNNFPF